MWVITGGGTMLRQLDPTTLMPVADPIVVEGGVSAAAVDRNGTLWTIDGRSGRVAGLRNGRAVASSIRRESAAARLVLAGDAPLVVSKEQITVLDTRNVKVARQGCLPGPLEGDEPITGSGPELDAAVIVQRSTGAVLVVGADGTCRSPIAFDVPGGSRYGAPIVHGRRIYIPQLDAGAVAVVDVDGGATSTVALGLSGHGFELFSHQGYVWFQQRATDTVGVIHPDGTHHVFRMTGPPPDGGV